jgi:hypothetical protein
MCRSLGVPVSISERLTVAGGFRPREAQPVAPGAWSPEQAVWGLTVGPLGSDEILLEGTANRLRAWAPPGVPLSGTADEALQRWRVATSPSGHALDPTAFSDVTAVAVGEVLDAVPRTLHAWVTTTTHRALARLELFLRTGMRVADRPMTTAQAAAEDLRRELSESDRARRVPLRVSRRAFGAGEHARAALDGFVAALAHRLIAAMTADVFELSLEQQRWREHSEALHDHEIACGSISSLATDGLRELCGSSLWSRHESESLLQRYSEAVTQASSIPAAVQMKQFALSGQVFSGVSCPPSEPDEGLWRDDFKRYDGRSAWESASQAFLSAARWASEGRRDSEQAERLIDRRLHGVWGEKREPDPRIADYTIHVRALGAFLATHAAQPGEVSCSACEEGSDVGHRRVPVTEADGAAEALARIVGAQAVPASMVLILGSFPHTTPVSSFQCDVDAGEFLIGATPLDFGLDRSLHYLPKLVGVSASAPSAPHQRPSEPLARRDSYAGWRPRVHTPGSCGACGAPMAESAHRSAPLSMV